MLLGVTSDGRGHLYVCDYYNSCVPMFVVSNGGYNFTALIYKLINYRHVLHEPIIYTQIAQMCFRELENTGRILT